MDGADIDSESQGGVKDLKSRFEKLATVQSPVLKSPQKPPPPPPPPPVYADTLSASNIPEGPYSHNHSRSPSSSHSDMADSSSLRSSSSLGDLKGGVTIGTGAKRAPPPPPPPRGSKPLNPPSPSPTPSTSPSNSLLLRPVPVPPSQQSAAALTSLDVHVSDVNMALPASVSSLKIRFTTANAQTPPAVPASPKTPARPPSALLAALGDPKPTIPPRPASILGFNPTNPRTGTTPDEVSPQSSRTSSRTASTDGDSEESVAGDVVALRSAIPPPVPARKQVGQTNGNGNGMGGATPTSTLRSLGAHFSDSSLTSCESDGSLHSQIQTQPTLPPRPTSQVPPPPPPRHHRLLAATATPSTSSALSPSTSTSTSTSSSSLNVFDHIAATSTSASVSAPNLHAASLNLPPPLPARRSTIVTETPTSSPASANSSTNTTPIGARKPLGSSRLPPPPMRMIGKGDKLPPARRACATSSDDEDEEDGDEAGVVTSSTMRSAATSTTASASATSKVPPIDLMPDSTSSSRRPPVIRYNETISEAKVSIHPHASWAFRGGVMAAGHGHKVKVWDLKRSEGIWREIDLRENSAGAGYGLGKDVKVTSLEFCGVAGRHEARDDDAGYVIWAGTKEGTLVEVDVINGVVRDVKHSGHLHPVTHIFRYGHAMVSMDESGKMLVFGPEEGGRLSLSYTTPRVIRTTEKQDFVKMIDGKLWTAARSDNHHHHLAHGLSVLSAAGSGALGLASSSTLSTSSTLTTMTTGTQKLPVIRIYDLFNPGVAGRSVLPSEYAGGVTSAAVLASEPGRVYVGHEEGYVSIWELPPSSSHSSPPSSPPSSSPSFSPPDLYPRCVEVMKISTSDILCLEGVYDRLWAGSRNGVITVYDVSVRPWVVTNCWVAHPGSPVVRMGVDVSVQEHEGRLVVVSVGRDEKVRLWDGLLGVDWVDTELLKREAAFSSFRELSVLIFSWNCDSARPDSLSGEAVNSNLFREVLQSSWTTSGSTSTPDILVFGFQEVIDLESRKMTAKNVVLGGGASSMKGKKSGKKGGIASSFSSLRGSGNSSSTLVTNATSSSLTAADPNDGLSDKVTGAYKRWHDYLCGAVKHAMPAGEEYTAVRSENLVGLFMCIFVKNAERGVVADVEVATVKRGMGGRYGNKGAIVARLVVGDSSICFINCHLAAGQHAVRRRNADVVGILEEKDVFGMSGYPSAYVGGGDGTMIMDHEFVFMAGDMNYRIDHRRDAIISSIKAGDLTSLLAHDQLRREMKHNRACRLRGFNEGVLGFAPTYKYDRKSGEYDTSDKQRAPAWCDRILWKARGGGAPSSAPGQGRVRLEGYTRFEANVSDHRPIAARFGVLTKRFDAGVRARVKAEVDKQWVEEQRRRLAEVEGFYVRQGLV